MVLLLFTAKIPHRHHTFGYFKSKGVGYDVSVDRLQACHIQCIACIFAINLVEADIPIKLILHGL